MNPRLPSAVRSAVGDARGPIGVACSGGTDSLVLADVCIRALGSERVCILHVDHGLSPMSRQVAEAVTGWAHQQGARAWVLPVVVAHGASLEAEARRVRYQALGAAASEHALAAVLTGHTRGDQAETVLMRVLRGSGPPGLAGVPRRRGLYRRPFLELGRAELAAYAVERGLPTVDDPMNADRRFLRVRVRHEALPGLAAFAPRIEQHLCHLADAMAEWTTFIDSHARPLLAAARTASTEEMCLCCDVLAAAPAAVAKRAVQLEAYSCGLDLERVHLEAIWNLLQQRPRGTQIVNVPGGSAIREYNRLRFVAGGAAASPPPPVHLRRPSGLPFELRNVKPGDRMRPMRLAGKSRKLSDLLIDAKVPREKRQNARVAIDAGTGEILWAEFVGPAVNSDVTEG